MEEHIVVYITAGSAEEAEKLGKGLVAEKLAFCANVIPGIKSYYHWEGKMHADDEWLMVVKTRGDCFDALKHWVETHHSYDVPEVIALPIVAGLDSYLNSIDDWVREKG